jgi:penicillin-binding protein 2
MNKFRPGASFSDFVIQDSSTRRSKIREPKGIFINVGTWIWLISLFGMVLLLVRLGSLQVIQGSHYRVLAEENRVKKVNLPAPRGVIYDRNNQILADNILIVEEKDGEKSEKWQRKYPAGETFAHVIGFVGEVGETEVGLLKSNGGKYDLGDAVGRSGLEQQFEADLRGVNGGRLVEVNNMGQSVRELGREEARPGKDMVLALDASLQATAQSALGTSKGAVVASNPKTGEVLTLVSSPSFDPNDLSAKYEALSAKEDLPFLNRAIGGIYPPGSTFKMVTAVAAMMENKVPNNFVYQDTGSIQVGTFSYTNWFFTSYGGTEGTIGWSRALARSTDTFFYKVGEMTGAEKMGKWAGSMGLGELSGIDLPGEVAGLIPSPDWKLRVIREQWFLGNTYHMAIGQGDILVTPLQVNIMTGILAANGLKCQPQMKKDARPNCEELTIAPQVLAIIHEGMLGACSDGGTAFVLFDFEPKIACKTGTSEYQKPDGKIGTHAWLTAYAPADDPTIAITALVEAGGEGSRAAAPIVRKVLSKYFGVEDHYNYSVLYGVGE